VPIAVNYPNDPARRTRAVASGRDDSYRVEYAEEFRPLMEAPMGVRCREPVMSALLHARRLTGHGPCIARTI